MLKALIHILGIIISLIPGCFLLLGAYLFAVLFLMFQWKRFSLMLGNLRFAFPECSFPKLLVTAIVSTARSFEQGLLVLSWPHISLKKLMSKFPISKTSREMLLEPFDRGVSSIWLIPHFCHADALSLLGHLLGEKNKVNTLYRPFKNKEINDFVKDSRERFGLKAINRKKGGLLKILKVLKSKQTIAMLFDQNAGGAGTRLEFMGKECSCTTLPDILYDKFKPQVFFVYTRRAGFGSSSIEVELMEELRNGQLVIDKANQWLEQKLRNDENLRGSWLWLHQRWKPGAGQVKKGKIR